MCGEKWVKLRCSRLTLGSPPRVRGKGVCPYKVCAAHGITPACAGKSHGRTSPSSSQQDHPRVCGEKDRAADPAPHAARSPPRVRGKGKHSLCRRSSQRITPACAGKRQIRKKSSLSSTDHPRVCGEKQSTGAYKQRVLGSPPRVRGKVRRPRSKSR